MNNIQDIYKKLQNIFPQLKKVTLVPITDKNVKTYHGFTSHNRAESKIIE